MPKTVTRPPTYTLHKASGQAIAKVNGEVHYLGPWESAESKVRYQEAVTRWGAQQVRAANAPHARRGRVTHGRHLETIKVGGRRFPSHEAIERFIERVTAAADRQEIPVRSAKQRARDIARAEAKLAA